MRSTVMSLSLIPRDEEPEDVKPKPRSAPRGKKRKGRAVTKGQSLTRKKKSPPLADEIEDPSIVHETEESIHERALRNKFPVVLTTYDIIMKDRAHLTRYPWGFIVVDEGHRLKNMDCKLMREIKQYESAGRMILTGTPLHVSLSFPWWLRISFILPLQNNLSELWSLLNFILPDIFNDLYSFQEWYASVRLPENYSQPAIGSTSRPRKLDYLLNGLLRSSALCKLLLSHSFSEDSKVTWRGIRYPRRKNTLSMPHSRRRKEKSMTQSLMEG